MNPASAAPPAASGVPGAEEIRPPQPSPGAPARIAADARLFAAMRFILALAALAIIYIDPVAARAGLDLRHGSGSALAVRSGPRIGLLLHVIGSVALHCSVNPALWSPREATARRQRNGGYKLVPAAT